MRFWNDGGFFSSVKGHVIKWWQLVIMPVLHINNNGRKTQYSMQQPPMQPQSQEQLQLKDDLSTRKDEEVVKSATEVQVNTNEKHVEEQKRVDGAMSTEDPMEVLRRINEEKEARRRKEIETAKKKASEEARIAAIMNANKVDVNAFIEAGKVAKEEIAAKRAEEQGKIKATEVELERKRQQEEDLRKAQEIMDRLNREAAEDEAKKQAEIEAAKQEAKKQFG